MAADLPPSTPDAAPVAAVTAPAPAAATPVYVDANGYRYAVNGNTLLSPEAIEAALRNAPGPKEAVDALDQAYRQAGYLLVVVGGQVNNKLVAIQVLQGRISEFEAAPEIAPYVRRLVGRDDLTRNVLLRDTSMMDLYLARDGMRPKASFGKAEQVGGTKLTVTQEPIEGAKPWNASLAFGNLGSRYSSRYTAAGAGSVRPGGGLELSATYMQGLPGLSSDSSGASYRATALGGSLVTPWGLYGANYSYTQYRIGEVQAPLYPAGEIESGGITGTQLVYADESSRLSLNQAVTWYSNTQFVYDDPDPSHGFVIVDQNYGAVSLGASYNRSVVVAGQNAAVAAGLTAMKGFSPRFGSFLPEGPGVPNPKFWLVQANVAMNVALPAGFAAGVTISGQGTDETLPQSQQWVLGGYGNLSAWLPAVLIGDSGALARATVTSRGYAWGEFSFSAGAFAEGGFARFSQRAVTDPSSRALADAGLSVTGTTTKGTNLTLAYAWPVWYRNVDGVAREAVDRSRANLYFTLNQAF